MFYKPENGHGLPHDPFKAIVSPRPIAWVSTQDKNGVRNLAPYSFFNAVASDPPQVIFSSTGGKPDRDDGKDTVNNIRETGEFCINLVSYALRDAMNASSTFADKGVDEFELSGLQSAPCETIACARVLDAPASLECRLKDIITLDGNESYMVLGSVTGVHLNDAVVTDGIFDVTAYQPLARLGYRDYAVIKDVFPLGRPGQN